MIVSQFVIYQNSYVYINFSVDNLKGIEDKFVIGYSYFNNLVFKTETKIYTNRGIYNNINYSYTHETLTQTSNPKIQSSKLS